MLPDLLIYREPFNNQVFIPFHISYNTYCFIISFMMQEYFPQRTPAKARGDCRKLQPHSQAYTREAWCSAKPGVSLPGDVLEQRHRACPYICALPPLHSWRINCDSDKAHPCHCVQAVAYIEGGQRCTFTYCMSLDKLYVHLCVCLPHVDVFIQPIVIKRKRTSDKGYKSWLKHFDFKSVIYSQPWELEFW